MLAAASVPEGMAGALRAFWLLLVCVAQRSNALGSARAASRRDALRVISGGGGAALCAPLGGAAVASQPVAVVTGASSGVGRAAALALARRGWRVLAAEHTAPVDNVLEGSPCDLASVASVRSFAAAVSAKTSRVDALLLIAGVDGAPRSSNEVAHEPHLAVNHLGHFALATALMPLLVQSSARVVAVTSTACLDADLRLDDLELRRRPRYDAHTAYANSKACNVLFVDELRRREPRLSVAAAFPGRCATQIVRWQLPQRAAQRLAMDEAQLARQARLLGLRTPEEGAALPVWLSVDAAQSDFQRSALWLDPDVPADDEVQLSWRTDEQARALWDKSIELTT